MGRKKKVEMDKLTADASNALKAGMSYGMYMAMKEPAKAPTPEIVGFKYTCQQCGKEFIVNNRRTRKYCGDRCRELAYYGRKMNEPTLKTCPICGKEFMAETHRNKYCSEFCSKVGFGQKVKEYHERKKEEAESNG